MANAKAMRLVSDGLGKLVLRKFKVELLKSVDLAKSWRKSGL